jgi:hypothetical protein
VLSCRIRWGKREAQQSQCPNKAWDESLNSVKRQCGKGWEVEGRKETYMLEWIEGEKTYPFLPHSNSLLYTFNSCKIGNKVEVVQCLQTDCHLQGCKLCIWTRRPFTTLPPNHILTASPPWKLQPHQITWNQRNTNKIIPFLNF